MLGSTSVYTDVTCNNKADGQSMSEFLLLHCGKMCHFSKKKTTQFTGENGATEEQQGFLLPSVF